MARSAWLDGWRSYIEKAHGLVVAEGIGLDDLHRLELLQPGFLCNLVLTFVGVVLEVAYVGDVTDVTHLVAEVSEQSLEYVVGDSRTGVAEVCVAIDGRAADIHADMTRINRDKQFLSMGQSIGKE